jgi:metal-dependent hydrolase (beta-lactamase superfamily II)
MVRACQPRRTRGPPRAAAEFSPDFLVPAHCTGWPATRALADRFPDAFIQNSVGTRFEFAGSATPST